MTRAVERRLAAIEAQADSLDRFAIDGIRHNIPFLSALMAHPRWREGRLSTGFIAEEYGERFEGVSLPMDHRQELAAIVAAISSGVKAEIAPLDSSELCKCELKFMVRINLLVTERFFN